VVSFCQFFVSACIYMLFLNTITTQRALRACSYLVLFTLFSTGKTQKRN
jgi:hypothetical protein